MNEKWEKITREHHGFYQVDEFQGTRIKDRTPFRVRFPSGTTMNAQAIVRQEVIVTKDPPFFAVQERVYFAVPYEGLPDIWLRAIDVDVQPAAVLPPGV